MRRFATCLQRKTNAKSIFLCFMHCIHPWWGIAGTEKLYEHVFPILYLGRLSEQKCIFCFRRTQRCCCSAGRTASISLCSPMSMMPWLFQTCLRFWFATASVSEAATSLEHEVWIHRLHAPTCLHLGFQSCWFHVILQGQSKTPLMTEVLKVIRWWTMYDLFLNHKLDCSCWKMSHSALQKCRYWYMSTCHCRLAIQGFRHAEPSGSQALQCRDIVSHCNILPAPQNNITMQSQAVRRYSISLWICSVLIDVFPVVVYSWKYNRTKRTPYRHFKDFVIVSWNMAGDAAALLARWRVYRSAWT